MAYVLLLIYTTYIVYAAVTYKGKNAINLLITVCFFQNIAIVLFSRILTPTTYTMIALVKEAYVILYIAIRLIKKEKLKQSIVFCILSVITIIVFWLAYGKGAIKGQLTSFRQLYLPFVFYIFGKISDIAPRDYLDILKYYVKICIWSVLFGIIEMMASVKLWTVLGLPYYAELKNYSIHLLNGMFKSFYTYDFFGLRLRRMASFLVDPVMLGQLLALGFLISVFCDNIYRSRNTKFMGITVLTLGLTLTLAKGGIMIAGFSTCILLGRVARKKGLSFIVTIFAFMLLVLFIIKSLRDGTSGSKHINGLVTGFRSLIERPLGNGIGSGGNMADLYGGYDYNSVAGDESYIGSLLVQMGLIGLVLNVLLWKKFFRKCKNSGMGKYINVFNVANVALFLSSFVNYTAISFTNCFVYIILGAVGLGFIPKDNKSKKRIVSSRPFVT